MIELNLRHQLDRFHLAVDFSIDNELMALFGPSGAGKSLTLQIVAGLVTPHAGRIRLHERLVFDHHQGINLPPQQRGVGYVMQEYTLFPHLSVAENIAYGLRGYSSSAKRQAVATMLDLIQMGGYETRRPHELSGGQKQRIALARALVINPQILLLDEPFSALDRATRGQLGLDVRHIQRQIGIPTLLVTHDLPEANILADRVAIYTAGRVMQIGSPAEVMGQPHSLAVARLTGMQNFFPATVTAVQPEGLQVQSGSLTLSTPPHPYMVGQVVQCCIRPEQIILLRPPLSDTRTNIVTAIVNQITTDGLSVTLSLALTPHRLLPHQADDLLVKLPLHVYESLTPQVGELWNISLKQSALHLLRE